MRLASSWLAAWEFARAPEQPGREITALRTANQRPAMRGLAACVVWAFDGKRIFQKAPLRFEMCFQSDGLLAFGKRQKTVKPPLVSFAERKPAGEDLGWLADKLFLLS